MVMRLFRRKSYLLAGILSMILVPPTAFAQQTGDKPAAPDVSKPLPSQQSQPTTVPGRPDIPNPEVAKQLRNVAPLPFGAALDKLPVGRLKVPKGFKKARLPPV